MSGSVIRTTDGKFQAVNDEPGDVVAKLNDAADGRYPFVWFRTRGAEGAFINVDNVTVVHKYTPPQERTEAMGELRRTPRAA